MLKFGISLLVLGLIVGGIGILATGQIGDAVRAGVNDDLDAQAHRAAHALENWDQRNRAEVEAIAPQLTNARNEPLASASVLERLQRQVERHDAVHQLYYVNLSEDQVIGNTGSPSLAGQTLSSINAPWGAKLASKDIVDEGIKRFGVYEVDGEPIVAYAAPAGSLSSQSQRALVYTVRLSDFQDIEVADDPGRVTYVVNVSEGSGDTTSVLYDSNGTAYFAQYPFMREAIRSVTPGNDGGESDDAPNVLEIGSPKEALAQSIGPQYRDDSYLVSYAGVHGTDWAVLVHTPNNDAYGFVTTVTNWGWFATLAGVLTIGIIGALVGRNTATAIDRLRKKSEEMEQGNLDVDFETDRIDNIGRLYDGMGSMRDALREQIVEAREAREEAELAREEAEQTSRHLQSKANEYRDVMQACAAGDLSQRMDPSERNEAMRDIAAEFNAMIAEIEQTVGQLKDFANEVATSSEEVTASAEEVRSASQQVTKSIQEISEGSERQNDSLQSVSQEMSGLSTTVEEIASLSNEVADLAERTAETGRQGREAAQEAIAGMNQIEAESEEAVEQIEILDEEMQQIDELIEFITDVADQTNMLALNANIEASRAGSGGGDAEGFAVVANEVKELAEETKEAAEDIESRLERIQDQTERTVEGVRTTGERISQNTDSVRNAVEALDEIAGYAQETNTGVQEISAATEEQAASTQQVVAMVDEAATISEKTSAEAQNVAAAAEEQTTAMTEVSDSASDLSQQASRLSEALDRFTTREQGEISADADPVPDPTPDPVGGRAADDGESPDVESSAGDGEMPPGVDELAAEFDDEALEEFDDADADDAGSAGASSGAPVEGSAAGDVGSGEFPDDGGEGIDLEADFGEGFPDEDGSDSDGDRADAPPDLEADLEGDLADLETDLDEADLGTSGDDGETLGGTDPATFGDIEGDDDASQAEEESDD